MWRRHEFGHPRLRERLETKLSSLTTIGEFQRPHCSYVWAAIIVGHLNIYDL